MDAIVHVILNPFSSFFICFQHNGTISHISPLLQGSLAKPISLVNSISKICDSAQVCRANNTCKCMKICYSDPSKWITSMIVAFLSSILSSSAAVAKSSTVLIALPISYIIHPVYLPVLHQHQFFQMLIYQLYHSIHLYFHQAPQPSCRTMKYFVSQKSGNEKLEICVER